MSADLKQLRELAKAATPGPWESVEKKDPEPNEATHFLMCGSGALGYWRGGKRYHTDSQWVLNKEDADYIVAACNALPELLDTIEKQRALILGASGLIKNSTEYRIGNPVYEKACADLSEHLKGTP